MSIELTILRF